MAQIDDYHKREAEAVNAIVGQIPPELRKGITKRGFVDLFRISRGLYLAMAVDGPGTKPILAIAMGKYDTIGIDAFAMSSNDLATIGSVRDLVVINYLPCQEMIEQELITAKIEKGIVWACQKTGTKIGKGETASVDEMLGSPRKGYGFDIGCTIVGTTIKQKLDAKEVRPGYIIIGLESSGPHCNGYTSLRHRLLTGDFEERPWAKEFYCGKYSLDDKVPHSNQTIGEALITPTLLYGPCMQKVTEEFPYVQGINITGYGLHNFNRISDPDDQRLKYHITDPIPPQPIFEFYQEETGAELKKMYTSFNMGMGFAMLVRQEDVGAVMRMAAESGMCPHVVGKVQESNENENTTILHKDGKEIEFVGYQ